MIDYLEKIIWMWNQCDHRMHVLWQCCNKQNTQSSYMCIYIYIYIYIYNINILYICIIYMKTMCPPVCHHNGFIATHAIGHLNRTSWTVHHVTKCMSCYKAIGVTTGGDILCMITYILCPSLFGEIWALFVWWITYDHFLTYKRNTRDTISLKILVSAINQ